MRAFLRHPRRSGLALAAALTLTTVAGCGGDDEPPAPSVAPPAATVAIGDLPKTYDPARAASLSERAIAAAAHTPLLTYRRSPGPDAGQLIPALARDMPRLTENEREYRFSLRPGLLYADGRLVTASDVERAIAHASKVTTNFELLDVLSGIEGAPSEDGETLTGVRSDDVSGNVIIKLRQPDGRIPFALADPATAPLPDLPSGEAKEPSTSTGPLRVARRTNELVELVANPLRPSIREVPASGFQRVTLVPRGPAGKDDVDLDVQPPETKPADATRQTAPAGPTWMLAVSSTGALGERALRTTAFEGLDLRDLPEAEPWTELRPGPPIGGRNVPAGLRSLVAACGVIPPYIVGAVERDRCPAPPREPGSDEDEDREGPTAQTVDEPLAGLTVVIATQRATATPALLRLVTKTLTDAGAEVTRGEGIEPLVSMSSGQADMALVRVSPRLPHPAGWMTPFGSFGAGDALVEREVPRLTEGPLTGTASAWAAIDRRLVDRATAVPLASERRIVDVGVGIEPGSVLQHPVLGLDLAGLAPR